MDITSELWAVFEGKDLHEPSSPSLFVFKATDLLSQIRTNGEYLLHVNDSYVDYHRYIDQEGMTDDERNRVGKEVAAFVAGVVSDVQELHRVARTRARLPSGAEATHYEEILSHVTKTLDGFTKSHKAMERERERLALNPCRLLTGTIDSSKFANTRTMTKLRNHHEEHPHVYDNNNTSIISPAAALSPVFAERYESEVAKPSLMKKYDDIVNRQKASLLKEAKHLTVRFSEELHEVTSAEASSVLLSSMLTDFMGILAEQSEQVDVVSGSGRAATEAVKQTDAELQLTLERTESHQKNMVLLACSLAILLILLDWASP